MHAEREVCYSQAYKEATQRVIAQRKGSKRGAHVLSMGSGSGFFSAVAGKEGADSVLACDVHQPMANLTQMVHLFPLNR